MLSEVLPRLGVDLCALGELLDSLPQTAVQCIVVAFDTIHRDNRKMRWHAAVLEKRKQGRYQLPPSQVASAAKYDEVGWFKLLIRGHNLHPSLMLAEAVAGYLYEGCLPRHGVHVHRLIPSVRARDEVHANQEHRPARIVRGLYEEVIAFRAIIVDLVQLH